MSQTETSPTGSAVPVDCLICSRTLTTGDNYLRAEDADAETLCRILGLPRATDDSDCNKFMSIFQEYKYCDLCIGRIREMEAVMKRLDELERRLQEDKHLIEKGRILIEGQLESSWSSSNITDGTTNFSNQANSYQKARRQILTELNCPSSPQTRGNRVHNPNLITENEMCTTENVNRTGQVLEISIRDSSNYLDNSADRTSGVELSQDTVMRGEPFSPVSHFSYDNYEEKYEIPTEAEVSPETHATPASTDGNSTNLAKKPNRLQNSKYIKCPFEPQCKQKFLNIETTKLATHLKRRHKVNFKLDIPKVFCDTLESQLKSQCIICGIKLTGQQDSENGAEMSWKLNCAQTLCTTLGFPTNPFETIFQWAEYCQSCGSRVCEIELTSRQSLALLERLQTERDRIATIFGRNVNGISGGNKNKVKKRKSRKTDLEWSNGYNNAVRLIQFQLRQLAQKSDRKVGQSLTSSLLTTVELETDLCDDQNEAVVDDEMMNNSLGHENPIDTEILNDGESVLDNLEDNDGLDFDFEPTEAMPNPINESIESPKSRHKAMVRKYKYTIKCEVRKCRTKFRTEELKKLHILKKHEGNKTPFQCKDCNRKFSMKSKLQTHAISHSNERPFICEKCGFASKYRGALSNHVKLVHDRPRQPTVHQKSSLVPPRKPKIFRCNYPKCRATFEFEENRTTHYRRRHQEDKMPYHCSECEKRFSLKGLYTAHLRIHVEGKQFFCEHCGGRYKHLSTLEIHIRRKHTTPSVEQESNIPDRTLSCDICNKVFDTAASVEAHKESHLKSETPFQCQDCQQVFTNSNDLQKHHKFKHAAEKRGFPCDVCDSVLSSRSGLLNHKKLRHEVRDSNAWRFSCNLCDSKYYFKSGLILHKQERHPDDTSVPPIRLFVCDFCSKGFKWKQGLMRHRAIHTGETPYVCKVCGKGFRANNDLKSHEEIHAGVRAHVCAVCGKTFRAKNNLFHHMHSHTGKGRKHGQKHDKRNSKFYIEAGTSNAISDAADAVDIPTVVSNTGTNNEEVQLTNTIPNRPNPNSNEIVFNSILDL